MMKYLVTLVLALLITSAIISSWTFAQGESGMGDPSPAASASEESFARHFFISRVRGADGESSIDLVGSFILWILLGLSVTSIGLIGMMAMTNQRKAYAPTGVINEVRTMLMAGKLREAADLTAAEASFFSRVIHAALAESNRGFNSVIRSLEQTADELATVRLRRIEYLNILAQVCPMIGLFGTVWGMILAFRAIVVAGGNADPVLLAGGIGTALTTTFWGLLIAIPALAAYAMLRNRIDELTTDATRQAEELLNQIRAKPTKQKTES